jgi:hypothetical protein
MLSSCTQYYDREYPHQLYADNVLNNFVLEQQGADTNIEVYSTGGGIHEHIERMSVGFIYNKVMSIEELRVLFVKYNEWFRYRVNTQLKEYLKSYPAPIHEFQIEVAVMNPMGKTVPHGLPCFAAIVQGFINYCTHDLDPELKKYDTLYVEPYEDALEIVRNEHPEVLPPEYLLPAEEFRAIASSKNRDPKVLMIPTKR